MQNMGSVALKIPRFVPFHSTPTQNSYKGSYGNYETKPKVWQIIACEVGPPISLSPSFDCHSSDHHLAFLPIPEQCPKFLPEVVIVILVLYHQQKGWDVRSH